MQLDETLGQRSQRMRFNGTSLMFPSLWFLIALVAASISGCKHDDTASEDKTAIVTPPKIYSDVASKDFDRLVRYLVATKRLSAEIQRLSPVFEADGKQMLSVDERRDVLALFTEVLIYGANLEGIAKTYLHPTTLNPLTVTEEQTQDYLLGYAAMIGGLDVAVDFIRATMDKARFEVLLDEGDLANGTPKGAFKALKYNYLHIDDISRFVWLHQFHKLHIRKHYEEVGDNRLTEYCRTLIDERYYPVKDKFVWDAPKQLASNGLDILKDGSTGAFFPIQAGVAEWMGDTKVRRPEKFFIQPTQIAEAQNKSEPGDIFIERRNWFLSNVGLPGFWPHAALYLGSPEELADYFNDDAETLALFGKPFSEHLKETYPEVWKAFSTKDTLGHEHRVLEAQSEGVIFTTTEHSLDCDYAAALRPRRRKVDKARAIEAGMKYFGRPYDFNFDFFSDSSLVCSELVYKAYEDPETGVQFPLQEVVGRKTLPVNIIARLFDEQAGTPEQQMDFVWFLDSTEKDQKAFFSTEASFRESHKRPQWDVAQR